MDMDMDNAELKDLRELKAIKEEYGWTNESREYKIRLKAIQKKLGGEAEGPWEPKPNRDALPWNKYVRDREAPTPGTSPDVTQAALQTEEELTRALTCWNSKASDLQNHPRAGMQVTFAGITSGQHLIDRIQAMGIPVMKTSEAEKLVSAQRFREEVSNVVVRKNVHHANKAFLDKLTESEPADIQPP